MAINVSVQHNGGFLPDIIILTQCYYHRGTRLNAMESFCICSLWSHLSVLTFSPLCGCSEGLDGFRFFFKHQKYIFPRHAMHYDLCMCLFTCLVSGVVGTASTQS